MYCCDEIENIVRTWTISIRDIKKSRDYHREHLNRLLLEFQ